MADELGPGASVAALTRDARDVWAENREYLLKLGMYLLFISKK